MPLTTRIQLFGPVSSLGALRFAVSQNCVVTKVIVIMGPCVRSITVESLYSEAYETTSLFYYISVLTIAGLNSMYVRMIGTAVSRENIHIFYYMGVCYKGVLLYLEIGSRVQPETPLASFLLPTAFHLTQTYPTHTKSHASYPAPH